MSFVNIETFIVAGEKSLKNKNYWSALAVALMLPSMCSRLAYKKEESYFRMNKTGESIFLDKKCYIAWCKANLESDGYIKAALGSEYAEILYTLRCDIIHAGSIDICKGDKDFYLVLGDRIITTEFTKSRLVNVKALCETLFYYVKIWVSNYGIENCKFTRVFDSSNQKDMLEYEQMCNEDIEE